MWSNGDFEGTAIGSGAPSGWSVTPYLNPGITDTRPSVQTLASLNLGDGGGAMTTIVGGPSAESQVDPDIGADGTLRYPKYGQRAMLVNYGGQDAPGNGQNSNSLEQTMTVGLGDVDPTDNKIHVRFAIAPVLENPGHLYTQQPYYYVRLQNLTTGVALYQDFNASGQPGVPWKDFQDTSFQAAQYTDWQLVDISPGNNLVAVGDSVQLTIVASGCAAGGHWGRVYVDAVGSGIPGLYAWATGPQNANAGSTITYTVNYKNGGTTTTPGTAIDFVTPPNTTFSSVSLGAACTAPTVGVAGTISCPLGTLAQGATDSFDVTVTIDAATANGTLITNGNYSIQATGVSSLIGPKVNTNVTSNVTYADLQATLTDHVAAIGWGQATSYTLTVTNAGPSAAASATVVDTMPAQLTGVTWTCTATGGGSCAASGSGSINDTTLALPVGATATYTITGSIVAGSGTGSIIQTATVTVGGSVSDPDSTSNTPVDTDAIGTLRTLSLIKLGTTSAGSISSTPAAISCGGSCASSSAQFVDGASVVLTAAPDTGATFVGWGGACSGAAISCTVSMIASLTVSATFASAPTSVVVSAGSPQSASPSQVFTTPLAVLVIDANSVPVPGVVVTFAAPATGARATFSSTTTTTNASGIASTTATANATAGAYIVTATVPGVATAASFSLANVGAPATITTTGGSPQTATVQTAFATSLGVVVRDSASQPVPNISVTFSAPSGGASALLSATTVTTDATGAASITATAGSIAGSYAVTAAVTGVTSASFALTNTAGVATSLVGSAGTAQTATVGTAFETDLQITVTDALGNPVVGTTITFTAPATAASAILGSPTATTNAAGIASVTATATTTTGSYAVTATATGLPTATFSLGNTAGVPTLLSLVAGTSQQTTVATAFVTPLAVRATDTFGNQVPNATISFTAPSSGASATLSFSTGITGATGLAAVLASANTVAGSYLVTAQVGAVSTTFALTNTAGAAATISVISGAGQSTTAGDPFAVPLIVNVVDAYGNAVAGTSVTTSVTSGTAATATITPATTDASGHASMTATAGPTAGTITIHASVGGVAVDATFAMTIIPGPAATVAVVSGANQAPLVGHALATPLVVRVSDAHANPIIGATVTFTAPSSGASATPTSPTATTAADGTAQVTATATTIAGAYSVTASVTGATSASFPQINHADVPTTMTVGSTSSPQTALVLTAFGAPLTITVADHYGNPTPNIAIAFTGPTTGAHATLSAPSATTDATGIASITAIASATSGAYVVLAAVAGIGDPVALSLTNVAGAPSSLVLVAGDTQSTVVDTAFATALSVTVLDANGNPVPNATIAFTAPEAPATASLAASSVATDVTGTASVIATASTVTGSYQVVASLVGGDSPIAFHLTNTAGLPVAIVATSASSPQVAQVNTAYGHALNAIVTDGFGNAVPNAAVTYTAPSTGATVVLSSTTALTSSTGRASITATAGTIAGAAPVTAQVAGVETPAAFTLTNIAGVPSTIQIVAGATQSATAGTQFATIADALVLDSFGNPVSGADVTFAAPTPVTVATATWLPATIATDATGHAHSTATASTHAGSYVATATTDSAASPATLDLTNLADIPATITASSSSTPQTTEVGHGFATALIATVLDQYTNPVPNAHVTFAAPTMAATATLSDTDITTGLDGTSHSLAIANVVAGPYTVTATVAGVVTPATFALSNSSAAAHALIVTAGAGQHAMATTAFAAALKLRAVDAFGNAVAGATVQLSMPMTGPSATASTNAPISDGSGDVEVTLVSGASVGSFDVTATLAGATTPVTAALTVDAIPTVLTATAPDTVSIDAPLVVDVSMTAVLGTPTGSVQIVDDAGTVLGTGTLTDGATSIHLELAKTHGSHSYHAMYAAQGSYGASQSTTFTSTTTEDAGSLSGGAGGCATGGGGGGLASLLAVGLVLGLITRSRRRGALVVGAMLATAATAGAEPQARDIDRLHPAAPDSDWIVGEGLTFSGHAQVVIGAIADGAHHPFAAYNADGTMRSAIISDSVIIHGGASVTLGERYRLSASVPMAVYQNGTTTEYDGMMIAAPIYAFGDVTLGGDLRIVGSPGDPLRIGVGFRVQLPTGSKTNYTSDGVVGYEPRLMAAGTVDLFEYAASASALLRGHTALADEQFGSELRYSASAGVRIADRRLLVGGELFGAVAAETGTAMGTPLELDAAARFAVNRQTRIGAAFGHGFINAIGSPDWRAMVTIAWSPE